ncbi:hypothetical protein [Nereida sp. MMG025]|uniref:hypothetical protein n=1 Tax=Nereida sp. MMG025 TaxID=2909981 RepID=UPI001F27CBF7|nr:hypothetical protein [Nereida sp. MMG025]MCF6443725.1 hypothetical protein [Nereida sp. MMG025]
MTWIIRILMVALIGLTLYAARDVLASLGLSANTRNAIEDADVFFGPLPISGVRSYKPRHIGPYGCTYVLLRLEADAPEMPPKLTVSKWGPTASLEQDGGWQPTPQLFPDSHGSAQYCFTGFPEKMDGVGIDGHADELLSVLQSQGAWVSFFGGGEGQYMALYSAEHRLAFRLRWGD